MTNFVCFLSAPQSKKRPDLYRRSLFRSAAYWVSPHNRALLLFSYNSNKTHHPAPPPKKKFSVQESEYASCLLLFPFLYLFFDGTAQIRAMCTIAFMDNKEFPYRFTYAESCIDLICDLKRAFIILKAGPKGPSSAVLIPAHFFGICLLLLFPA